jgi:hypothetical protein
VWEIDIRPTSEKLVEQFAAVRQLSPRSSPRTTGMSQKYMINIWNYAIEFAVMGMLLNFER